MVPFDHPANPVAWGEHLKSLFNEDKLRATDNLATGMIKQATVHVLYVSSGRPITFHNPPPNGPLSLVYMIHKYQ